MHDIIADAELLDRFAEWLEAPSPDLARAILSETPNSPRAVCAYLVVMHEMNEPAEFDLDGFAMQYQRVVAGARAVIRG